MIVGFTGTRTGMREPQWDRLTHIIPDLGMTEVHHGCCLGADTHFAELIHTWFDSYMRQVGHPSEFERMTSKKAMTLCSEVLPARPALDRNRDIVDACNLLLACPADMEEQQRSGTWATIRYGRKVGRRIIIVFPDGTVSDEAGH